MNRRGWEPSAPQTKLGTGIRAGLQLSTGTGDSRRCMCQSAAEFGAPRVLLVPLVKTRLLSPRTPRTPVTEPRGTLTPNGGPPRPIPDVKDEVVDEKLELAPNLFDEAPGGAPRPRTLARAPREAPLGAGALAKYQ